MWAHAAAHFQIANHAQSATSPLFPPGLPTREALR